MILPRNNKELIKFRLKTGLDLYTLISDHCNYVEDVREFDEWITSHYSWLKNHDILFEKADGHRIQISVNGSILYDVDQDCESTSYAYGLYERVIDDEFTQ